MAQQLTSYDNPFIKLVLTNTGTSAGYIGTASVSVTGGLGVPKDMSIEIDLQSNTNKVYAIGSGAIISWMALK